MVDFVGVGDLYALFSAVGVFLFYFFVFGGGHVADGLVFASEVHGSTAMVPIFVVQTMATFVLGGRFVQNSIGDVAFDVVD